MENFRRKLLLGALSITGSVVILGGFLYWMSGIVAGQARKVVAQRNAAEQQAQLVASLASLKTMAPEVAKYKQAVDSLLPKRDDLVNFPAWIEGLARAHKVSNAFTFQGSGVSTGDGQPGSIGFTLDARGAYGDLVDFLKDIEFKAPRYLVSIDDFDVMRDGPAYRVSAHGKAFFAPGQ